MGVALELGRILLASGARAAARGLERLAAFVTEDAEPDDRFFVEADPGPLVSHEAADLIAYAQPTPEPVEEPPLEGSLASRGRRVGQPWAR